MAVGIYQKQRQNLDQISLVSRLYEAETNIDSGRKGFAIRGKEQEGRINYETGIDMAMTAFQEAQISTEPQAMLLAEYTFTKQEFKTYSEHPV